MVYLDYSATSPLLPSAKTVMLKAMELVGNPSALHTPGHLAMNLIEEAREEVARLIGAEPSEIIFTSGGSESNNTVTNIFAGQSVAVSAIEHPSLLESARARCNVTIIPVDEWGKADDTILSPTSAVTTRTGERFGEKIVSSAPLTALVSVMLGNNEIGTINDIKSLAKTAHKHGSLFHSDATQALGKINIDVKDLDVDYLTISAHKIGGPVGIGALYVKNGAPFKPFIIGGHQEHGRRAGTYQTVNIAGFGAAAKYAREKQTWRIYADKIRLLRDLLAKRILTEIPYSSINSPIKSGVNSCLPNLLNCSFEAAEGESIQLYLDAEGDIIVSTGSACAAGNGRPSHVLMATRNDAEIAHSSIRFSFGLDTSEKDVDHIMKYLPGIVNRLQSISTIKPKDKHYEK